MRTKLLLAVFVSLFCLAAGPARATLYFPHADITEGWQTNICLINNGTQAVSGTMKAYSDAGQSMITPAAVTLNPHERKVYAVGSTWPAFTKGYFVFETKGQTLAGYTEFAYQGQQRAAIPAVARVNQGDLYLFHIDNSSIWWTGLALANTTSVAKTVDITFNNGAKKSLTIPANGHVSKSLTDLFKPNPVPEAVKQGHATITKAAGVVGLALFGQWPDAPPVTPGMKNFYLEGIELKSTVGGEIVLADVKSNATWWTGIDAYNPTDATSTLTIQPYASTGTALDGQDPGERLAAKTVTIAPKSKYVAAASSIGLPAGTNWLKLTATTPITGFQLFGTWDGVNLGGYNAAGVRTRTGVLPKIDDWTGVRIVNPGSTAANVTYSAYSNAGALVAQKSATIAARGQVVGKPVDIFSPSSVTGAAYFTFNSTQELTAFTYLETDDAMLECIPALVAADPVEMVVDQLLDVLENPDNAEMLSEILSLVITAISGGSGTCPTVTTVPATIDWDHPPALMTFTVSYGAGCSTTSGDTMAGSAVITLTDFSIVQSPGQTMANITMEEAIKRAASLGTKFSLDCNNIRRNGAQVLDGQASGQFSLATSGSVISTASASLSSDNFLAMGKPFLGDMSLTASNVNLSAGTFGSVLVTLNDVWLDAAYLDGTASLTGSMSNLSLDVNMVTNEVGTVDLTLTMAVAGDVSTFSGSGTLGSYNVSVNNVVYNTAACAKNPTGGTIVLTRPGETITVTFKNACSPADFYDITRS
jgi:hypothetical protein